MMLLHRPSSGGDRLAQVTGSYKEAIGIPSFASFLVSYSTTVTAPLPAS